MAIRIVIVIVVIIERIDIEKRNVPNMTDIEVRE